MTRHRQANTLVAQEKTTRNQREGGHMAQFLARIQGNRGDVTRLGSKQSGASADVNGWTTGATVRIAHIDGRDVVRVHRTTGSAGSGLSVLIAEWTADSAHVFTGNGSGAQLLVGDAL